MSAKSKKHEAHDEEHGGSEERWLVSYADLITVLMILFVVMFALSQVDQRKFNALKEGRAAGFGQSTSIKEGSSSILSEAGLAVQQPIAPNQNYVEVEQVKTSEANDKKLREQIVEHDRAQFREKYREAEQEVNRLSDILKRLNAALAKHDLVDDVDIAIDNRGLVLSLVSKHVVFEANLATLSTRGRQVVDTLAPVLADIPDPLQIDGHTNQEPVKPKYYPTDWELSAARAVTVLRHLNEVNGIPTSRMSASAFGHEKPRLDPKTKGSQRVNKRVDIVILSTQPGEIRELINEVVTSRTAEGEAS